LRILTVIGNRPQFIKAAAVTPHLRRRWEETLVHTGQHYDDELSAVFFEELGLPPPDIELGINRGSNSSQTARMLAALEPLVERSRPDAVLVYGDTNSTLAGALAGAQGGVPVAHVEAGMRSFDMTMPEELNRVLTDHASALLLCPSPVAVENLQAERVSGRVCLVGDVMVDVAQAIRPGATARVDLVRARGLEPQQYLLATAHRAGNVDDDARLEALVGLLCSMPQPVVLPLHPRTRRRLTETGLLERLERADRLQLTEPLGYLEFAALLGSAAAVLTDSGGLQKEAYLAGVRCVTLRASTEWLETVQQGWNTLVDLDVAAALDALSAPLPESRPPLYGDGRAGERVVAELMRAFSGEARDQTAADLLGRG
jgi:UDP-N-acetylglucosamine 2-epimerase (non-hydrolysing)/UDP-GlcNAc3NAcA epimerase